MATRLFARSLLEHPRDASVVRASIDANQEAASGDRAWVFRCPDGIEHVFVCDVSGRGAGVSGPADFLAQSARILLCQGMSVELALETLVLTTDGVLDACSVNGERLSHHGLARSVRSCLSEGAEHLASRIAADVRSERRLVDDYAIVTATVDHEAG